MKVFEVFILLGIISFACANASIGHQQKWNHNHCCKNIDCCSNVTCCGAPECLYDQDTVFATIKNLVSTCVKYYCSEYKYENFDDTSVALSMTDTINIFAACMGAFLPTNLVCTSQVYNGMTADCSKMDLKTVDFENCMDKQIKSYLWECALLC